MMKGQAALAEALVASLVLMTAGTVVAATAYQSSLSHRPASINMQNAEFDIESVAYSGTYLGGCIRNASMPCMSGMLQSVNEHYGLSYSKLQVGAIAAASGNYMECGSNGYYCFPLAANALYEQVCEYLCSD